MDERTGGDRAAVPFRPADAALPDAPVITYLDDTCGERVTLTAAELADQAARTAVLLRDDCGVGPGSRCAVLLPPHWRSAGVLLGCWATGAAVEHRPWATAGLAAGAHADAVFVSGTRMHSWLEEVPPGRHRFVVGLDGPVEEVPAGYWDFAAAVRGCDPADAPQLSLPAGAAATPDGTTHREWGQLAREIAQFGGLRPGDRVLIDADDPANEHPVQWLLAPVSVGATVVLHAGGDAASRARHAAAEHVTRVWRADASTAARPAG
ncbi:MAG TPA: TIGR03089 family protein [Pilimelia sp.]|nr:TIGR03089 family protein [Pilimelia sp.]